MESEPERGDLAPRYAQRLQPLRTTCAAHHDVERRPRWTFTYGAEEFPPCLFPIRELVIRIPAPCRDHCKNEEPTFAEQLLISARIEPADLIGHMGEIELDGPVATRLEINE
jgi:hypothetical protein